MEPPPAVSVPTLRALSVGTLNDLTQRWDEAPTATCGTRRPSADCAASGTARGHDADQLKRDQLQQGRAPRLPQGDLRRAARLAVATSETRAERGAHDVARLLGDQVRARAVPRGVRLRTRRGRPSIDRC